MTRRALVGGATASTVALVTGDCVGLAQSTPPVRTKGPPVWLEYDQQDMDDV